MRVGSLLPNGPTSYTINPVPYFPIIAGSVTWTDALGNVLGTGSSVSVTPSSYVYLLCCHDK